MACIYTHNRFALEVLPKLSEEAQDIARSHMDLYRFGNQGPDLYFFNFRMAVKKNAPGTFIHDRPGKNFIIKNVPVIKRAGLNSETGAYMIGSILHFILDSHIHPTVNKLVTPTYSHLDIETELDRFYMILDGNDPFVFRQEDIIPDSALAKYIYPLYKGYPDVNLKETEKAMRDFKKVRKFFHPSSQAKENFLLTVMKIPGLSQFSGQILRQEPLRPAAYSNKVLAELIDETMEKAPELLKAAMDFIKGEVDTLPEEFNCNYNGVK